LPGLPIYVARFPAAPFTPGTVIWVRVRTVGLKGRHGRLERPGEDHGGVKLIQHPNERRAVGTISRPFFFRRSGSPAPILLFRINQGSVAQCSLNPRNASRSPFAFEVVLPDSNHRPALYSQCACHTSIAP